MSTQRLASACTAALDEDELLALVRAYHERVTRFGVRVCRDRADADDAVQEAFAKLARRPEVARDPGLLSWLFSVVRRACLRLLRPLSREQRLLGERGDLDDAVASELDPERALAQFELVRTVHAAIASLDREAREVLVLRDLMGLSGEETSAALSLPLAAMKTRLHRARGKLRERLREVGLDRHVAEDR